VQADYLNSNTAEMLTPAPPRALPPDPTLQYKNIKCARKIALRQLLKG